MTAQRPRPSTERGTQTWTTLPCNVSRIELPGRREGWRQCDERGACGAEPHRRERLSAPAGSQGRPTRLAGPKEAPAPAQAVVLAQAKAARRPAASVWAPQRGCGGGETLLWRGSGSRRWRAAWGGGRPGGRACRRGTRADTTSLPSGGGMPARARQRGWGCQGPSNRECRAVVAFEAVCQGLGHCGAAHTLKCQTRPWCDGLPPLPGSPLPPPSGGGGLPRSSRAPRA